MSAEYTTVVVFVLLLGSIILGIVFRRLLPADHFQADTKETVKLAMGLVATMAALILGLLVSSAKGSYDANRSSVIQLSAKITLLDRALEMYGQDGVKVRSDLHSVVLEVARSIWPDDPRLPVQLAPDKQASADLYAEIIGLRADTDLQKNLKNVAGSLAVEIGQIRSLLQAQTLPSISMLLLGMVVLWLFIIFFCFSLIAPANRTSGVVLVISAISVAGAVLLLLELDRPFDGLIRISSDPLFNAFKYMVQG